VFEIGSVLAGSVDAHVEVGLGMLLVQLLQALVQSLVAGAVFENGQGLGGGLAIGAQEGDAMAVACGVDADADTVQGAYLGHNGSPEGRVVRPGSRRFGTGVARELVSLLREIFGQAILVISGPGRKMYQNLKPKPEGTIFSKRSEPQGSDRTPHDATTIMAGG
jgi:hypothetical protein